MNVSDIVARMTKEQCLAILQDPRVSVEALQRSLVALVNGGGAHTAADAARGTTTQPTPATTNGATTTTAPKAPKATTTPKGPNLDPMSAIKTFLAHPETASKGFAAGDIAALCKCDSKDSAVKTAIKNAVAAGLIHAAGERRFTRYAATKELAEAASLAARGKA